LGKKIIGCICGGKTNNAKPTVGVQQLLTLRKGDDTGLTCYEGKKKEHAFTFLVWSEQKYVGLRGTDQSKYLYEAMEGKMICIWSLRRKSAIQILSALERKEKWREKILH